MAPSNKAKAAGVSASSFLDLKAELAKHESELAKSKASGNETYTVRAKRPDKKPTVWARQNKGVLSRSLRDVELELSRPTLETARAALEHKAKIYEKLRKGKTGGLSEKQYESLLVDFDTKAMDDQYESDSDDVDESLTVPRPLDNYDNDPIVEYEDEFGRMRSARRSEIPRNLLHSSTPEGVPVEEDPNVIYNPVNHFPVYEPSADRVAAIAEEASDAANPLETHYDASKEVRAKGAAFYTFSADEEIRRRQMEELKTTREETQKIRKEKGAVDIKPGEMEGMRFGEESDEGDEGDEGDEEELSNSYAIEKRKRETEESREPIEEKKRKVATTPPTPVDCIGSTLNEDEDNPFSKLEKIAAAKIKGKSKSERRESPADFQQSEADRFLADLEREMLGTKANR